MSSRSLLQSALPPELVFRIAEDICWDLVGGWDSARLVPFAQTCRQVHAAVQPLIRSSIKGRRILTRAADSPWVRSITITDRLHECNAQCTLDESTCLVPHVVRYHQTLVHLELQNCKDSFLSELSKRVLGFPSLRYLFLGGHSVTFKWLFATTCLCPNLENLVSPRIERRYDEGPPKEKAPFRLRCFQLEAGFVDPASFRHLIETSLATLQHLVLNRFGSSTDMPGLADVQSFLTTLPRLSVFNQNIPCLTYILSFTHQLQHLRAQLDQLPPLDHLPNTLRTLQLDRPPGAASAWTRILAMFTTKVLGEQPTRFRATIELMFAPGHIGDFEELQRVCQTFGVSVCVDGAAPASGAV